MFVNITSLNLSCKICLLLCSVVSFTKLDSKILICFRDFHFKLFYPHITCQIRNNSKIFKVPSVQDENGQSQKNK